MDTEKMKKQIDKAFEKERKRQAFNRWMKGEYDDEVRDLIKEISEKAAAEQNEIIRKAKEIEDGKKSNL